MPGVVTGTEADIDLLCIAKGGTSGVKAGLAIPAYETGKAVTGSMAFVLGSGQTLSHMCTCPIEPSEVCDLA